MIGLLYRAADALRGRKLHNNHGRMGEDLAHRYLRSQGCTIVARNYRPRAGAGEIDLVAWHAGRLLFSEVKTRATAAFGAPESAVDDGKRKTLRHAARDYARRVNVPWTRTRFDIVSVVLETSASSWKPQYALSGSATHSADPPCAGPVVAGYRTIPPFFSGWPAQ